MTLKVLIVKAIHTLRRVYWYIFKPKRQGVKCLLIEKDEVLLVKNSYDDMLYMPGGNVRSGEDTIDAARRELKEETGIIAQQLHLIGIYTSQKEYKNDTIYLYYIDKYSQGNAVINDYEIDSFGFFNLNNLPVNTSKSTRKHISTNTDKVNYGGW